MPCLTLHELKYLCPAPSLMNLVFGEVLRFQLMNKLMLSIVWYYNLITQPQKGPIILHCPFCVTYHIYATHKPFASSVKMIIQDYSQCPVLIIVHVDQSTASRQRIHCTLLSGSC